MVNGESMHDVSVAQAVADAVLKKLKGKKIKGIEIDLDVGMLRFHDPEQVKFWIKEILRKEMGEGLDVRTSIKVIKPGIKCGCGFKGTTNSVETTEELAHHGVYEIKCPKCRSLDVEVKHGNECLIRSIRLD
jgi:Zn finger protein HypA/HybF involved in hydrogenase expression